MDERRIVASLAALAHAHRLRIFRLLVKRGRYAVDVEGMRKLLTYLTEDCCEGRPELCGEAFVAASKACRPKKGALK